MVGAGWGVVARQEARFSVQIQAFPGNCAAWGRLLNLSELFTYLENKIMKQQM